MRQEQDWRTLPLITMVHAPQTSSRQDESQTTGVVLRPSAVTGFAAICCRQEITLELGATSTLKLSQMAGLPGSTVGGAGSKGGLIRRWLRRGPKNYATKGWRWGSRACPKGAPVW